MASINYKELEQYKKILENKLDKYNISAFFIDTSRELTKELYSELKDRTPIVTGFLTHGWDVGLSMKYRNARLYPKQPVLYPKKKKEYYHVVDIDINKIFPDIENNKYTVHVKNPVSYAPFVEFGHYTTSRGRKVITDENGRIKLFNFKDNGYKKPRTEGHHMTELSVNSFKENKNYIISNKINKYFKG